MAKATTSFMRFAVGLLLSWVLALVALSWYCPSPLLSGELAVIPSMVNWWQKPLIVGGILAGAATLVFSVSWWLSRGRTILSLMLVLATLAASGWGYWHFTVDQAEQQPCANCRSFIRDFLDKYAEAHGGWFPKGGTDEWDSLSRAIGEVGDVHFFTSHALSRAAYEYWRATGKLSDEVCCYRYNEGLRIDDPEGVILLYYEYDGPGYWGCSSDRRNELGRMCLLHNGYPMGGGHNWRFLSEDEFQKEQAKTQALISERNAHLGEIQQIQSILKLVVDHTHPGDPYDPDTVIFEWRLVNDGERPLQVEFEESGTRWMNNGEGATISTMSWKDVSIGPGESLGLAWAQSLTIVDTVVDGRVVRRTVVSGSGRSESSYEKGMDPQELDAEFWAELWAQVRVSVDGRPPVRFTLASNRHHFLME